MPETTTKTAPVKAPPAPCFYPPIVGIGPSPDERAYGLWCEGEILAEQSEGQGYL